MIEDTDRDDRRLELAEDDQWLSSRVIEDEVDELTDGSSMMDDLLLKLMLLLISFWKKN